MIKEKGEGEFGIFIPCRMLKFYVKKENKLNFI